jgi:hypothetical protein
MVAAGIVQAIGVPLRNRRSPHFANSSKRFQLGEDVFAFCLPFRNMWLKLRNVLTCSTNSARLVVAR